LQLSKKGGHMAGKLLKELKAGEKGRVIKVRAGNSVIHRRILDMGITKGTVIELERIAPLGDPIEIKVKGYHLSLRKEEAANVRVEVDE
jgi:DtxR family transcriptional regulator, Mn-dependent transcriptional regulator